MRLLRAEIRQCNCAYTRTDFTRPMTAWYRSASKYWGLQLLTSSSYLWASGLLLELLGARLWRIP
jgi:hypothetical protein